MYFRFRNNNLPSSPPFPPSLPPSLEPSKSTHLNMLLIICRPPEPPDDGARPATAEKGKVGEGEEEEDNTLRRRRGV